MKRREFVAGVAALPALNMPFAGPFRRSRFATALEVVLSEKVRAGEVKIPVTSLNQRVVRQGRAATVADFVFDDVEPPWYVLIMDTLCEWIRENWDTILKVLLTILSLVILEPRYG